MLRIVIRTPGDNVGLSVTCRSVESKVAKGNHSGKLASIASLPISEQRDRPDIQCDGELDPEIGKI